MNTSFNAIEYVNNAAFSAELNGVSFYVREAAENLIAQPELGKFSEYTCLSWEVAPYIDGVDCLVARGPKGIVALVIYPKGHGVYVACDRVPPMDVVTAANDMLQCFYGGNEQWFAPVFDDRRLLAKTLFNAAYEKAAAVECSSEWSNGTGYFDGAVDAHVTELTSFKDKHGRRGILMPCEKVSEAGDSVVVFERYATEDTPLVFNAPDGYAASTSGLVKDVAHLLHRMTQVSHGG